MSPSEPSSEASLVLYFLSLYHCQQKCRREILYIDVDRRSSECADSPGTGTGTSFI